MICCFSTSLADVWHSEVLKQLMAIPQLEVRLIGLRKRVLLRLRSLIQSNSLFIILHKPEIEKV